MAYHQAGGFRRRYGRGGFRVLTVVATPGEGVTRLRNLKSATERTVDEVGARDLMSRFWFATLPELVLNSALDAPIWQVAGREGLYGLLADF